MIININIDFLIDNDYQYQYFEIVKKFTNLKIIKKTESNLLLYDDRMKNIPKNKIIFILIF